MRQRVVVQVQSKARSERSYQSAVRARHDSRGSRTGLGLRVAGPLAVREFSCVERLRGFLARRHIR